MFFSQLPPPESAAAIGWLAIAFFTIMGGLYYSYAVLDRIRNKKTELEQPIEVKAHHGIATVTQLKEVRDEAHGRMKRERLEIDAEIERVAQAAEKRTDRIEQKLDGNTQLTAEMKGELGQINQSVQNLSGSLTNFLRDQASR